MINPREYITKKNIIITCLGVGLIIALFIAYDLLVFRVKYIDPPLDKFPDSSVEIRFHFSQPIKSIDKVLLDDIDIRDEVKIDGSTIQIPIDEIIKGKKYSIQLEGISSKWFDNTVNSLQYTFTPQYVQFNQLSDEEKNAQIKRSHSGQVDDPFINKNVFPILDKELEWQIEVVVVNDNRSVILTITFFKEVPNYDKGGEVTPVSNETAEKYRTEILEEIKKRGGEPDNYTIIYKNKYLYNKYTNKHTH